MNDCSGGVGRILLALGLLPGVGSVVLLLVILGSPLSSYAFEIPADRAPPKKCLPIFDSMYYTGKSGVSSLGMISLQSLNAPNFWPDRKRMQELPRRSDVELWIRKLPNRNLLLAIDLEHWPVRGTRQEMELIAARYITLITWVRESGYKGPIGFYGLPPLRDYWRAIKDPESAEYKRWQVENDAYQSLANAVDVMLPSLYTFYDDIAGWETYAVANLREARRLAPNKPIYPYLWPQFHNSNSQLGYQFVSREMWARELEVVARYADGVVLWGSGEGWNEQAPWWLETKALLGKRACP
jgi:Hyaluronidase